MGPNISYVGVILTFITSDLENGGIHYGRVLNNKACIYVVFYIMVGPYVKQLISVESDN